MSKDQAGPQLGQRKEQIKFYADIMLKLSPVIATLVLGFVTYQFQSKNAAANLLSQREQAETRLRTALFENLIGPVSGSEGEEFDAEHQQLFVELLMLNFHEHIEFKPLLIHTDQRLANDIKDEAKKALARGSLQSVTRRVRDRQIYALDKACQKALKEHHVRNAKEENACEPPEMRFNRSDSVYENGKTWRIFSPTNEYLLEIRVLDMNWVKLRFELDINIFKNTNNENGDLEKIGYSSFSTTPFDLPFTDNMMVYGQQRFALGVSYIAPERLPEQNIGIESKLEPYIKIKAIWFPEGYILPHERPVNFTEIRNMLNLDD